SSRISLKVGGSFVVIHPGGVDIMGPKINLNGGGSAGTPVGVMQPGALEALADNDADDVDDNRTGNDDNSDDNEDNQDNTDKYYLQGNDSNLLIVFYVQIMPDDFVMQLHR
ncbi:hypothetical protein VC517_25185, partial [Citrobacter freundii]|nr:hypothetical protein [Citrobacter freundii]MEB0349550.1 hypothetical protein [Citrobacter freundii]